MARWRRSLGRGTWRPGLTIFVGVLSLNLSLNHVILWRFQILLVSHKVLIWLSIHYSILLIKFHLLYWSCPKWIHHCCLCPIVSIYLLVWDGLGEGTLRCIFIDEIRMRICILIWLRIFNNEAVLRLVLRTSHSGVCLLGRCLRSLGGRTWSLLLGYGSRSVFSDILVYDLFTCTCIIINHWRTIIQMWVLTSLLGRWILL